MHILKQLASVGLLNERLYEMPEDSEGDHTTVSQAKIDPSAPQSISGEANPQEAAPGDEADPVDSGAEPEVEDDEAAPDQNPAVQFDGARCLAALHASLHATQVLADLVYAAKDELVSKLGDEAAPALHEVLFKVKTAHETLAKMMDDVAAKPAEDEHETESEEVPPADDTTVEVPGVDAPEVPGAPS